MKKLREATEKSKLESVLSAQQHKKIKEEYETFKKKNADLFEASRKLDLLEKELYSAKSTIEDKEESIKLLRTSERNVTKELQAAKEEIIEINSENQRIQGNLDYVLNENKGLQTTLSTIKSNLELADQKMEEMKVAQEKALEKIQTIQSEMLDLRVSHTQAMESSAHEIDTLKFDIKELTININESDNELEFHKKELSTAQTKINDLLEMKKTLELELLDSADEIELFEEEIAAMQQFIREKSKICFLFSCDISIYFVSTV
jgi:chromosome segregation ATPase